MEAQRRPSRSPTPSKETYHDNNNAAKVASQLNTKRIYINNLPYSMQWQELKNLGRQAGDVAYADILMSPEGRSKGCGIIEYVRIEDARKAIEIFHSTRFQGRIIYVREDREPAHINRSYGGYGRDRDRDYDYRDNRPPYRESYRDTGRLPYRPNGRTPTVLIDNLPESISWQDLKDYFRSAGSVSRADVQTGPDGMQQGVVSFTFPDCVGKAISMFDGTDWMGCQLYVHAEGGSGAANGLPQRATDYGRDEPDYTRGGRASNTYAGYQEVSDIKDLRKGIWVGNLPNGTTHDNLSGIFKSCGTILRTELISSQHAGIVTFDHAEEAALAIRTFFIDY